MKKLVIIALTVIGAGIASSKADVVISFGGGGYYSQPAPYCPPAYTRHDALHDALEDDHADVHYDLNKDHKKFHKAIKKRPSLRYQHGSFHRELDQDHGDFHHEAGHDHNNFHRYDY
ncbi:MAG: hypothetical protein ABI042_19545 [Verrucomicrobiota bacterium]